MLAAARKLAPAALAVCVLALVCGSAAHAQVDLQDASGTASSLLELIRDGADNWADRLRDYALRLFWLLATIQLVWTFYPLVFRQAELGETIGELVRFVLVTGFFYMLLAHSVDWASAVVSSFRQAGGEASGLGAGLSPGDVLGFAIEMGSEIMSFETWNPFTAFTVALSGAIVVLCFAFVAAFMGVTIIESYIVINASVLFMGFGGSTWTREYAIAMARYALAVGAKLFVLTLIVGLIMQAAQQWLAAYGGDDVSMWTMVGLGLVSAYLSKQVPDIVQGLITGTSFGGGHVLGAMATTGLVAATAGAGALAGSVAGSSAAGGLGGGSSGGGLGGSLLSGLAGGPPSGSGGGAPRPPLPTPRIGGGGAAVTPPSSSSAGSNIFGRMAAAGTGASTGTLGAASRVTGVLGSLSVPGMEGAENIGMAPPEPVPPDTGEAGFTAEATPDNAISAAPPEGAQP